MRELEPSFNVTAATTIAFAVTGAFSKPLPLLLLYTRNTQFIPYTISHCFGIRIGILPSKYA